MVLLYTRKHCCNYPKVLAVWFYWTPENIAVIILKCKQCGFIVHPKTLLLLLCPQLERSWRDCTCLHPYVCLSVTSKTGHAMVLKFHIWIPHGRIADIRFFLSELSPLLELCPFIKSNWNLMHAISYKPCMLGFWNFMYGFLMEK